MLRIILLILLTYSVSAILHEVFHLIANYIAFKHAIKRPKKDQIVFSVQKKGIMVSKDYALLSACSGLAATLILIMLSAIFYSYGYHQLFFRIMMIVNLFIFMINAIPVRICGIKTDGYQIRYISSVTE